MAEQLDSHLDEGDSIQHKSDSFHQPNWQVGNLTQIASARIVNYQQLPTRLKPEEWEKYLVAYLEIAREPQPLPGNATQQIEALWKVPFHAHAPTQLAADRMQLWDAVQRNFEKDRQFRRIQRVVLLGDSGMGKSAALHSLCVITADDSLSHYQRYKTSIRGTPESDLDFSRVAVDFNLTIPFNINLADLKTNRTFESLIQDVINAAIRPKGEINSDQVIHLLRTFPSLLLLDGLDELHSGLHKGSMQILRQFMEAHPHLQYVITCRTAVYRDQLGVLDTLYLDNLSREETIRVLGEEDYNKLNRSLRQVVHNRGMLRLLLLDDATSNLENKGQLVQSWIRKRMSKLLQSSGVTDMDEDMIERLLEHLAYAIYRDHVRSYAEIEFVHAVRTYLETWGEPYEWSSVIRALRTAELLVRDDDRRWHFCDSTTAAYYAASYIRYNPLALEGVLRDSSNLWWRDVLEILVGLARSSAELFFQLVDHNVRLAAHCAQFAGNTLDSRIEDALVDGLIERMSQENAPNRCFIAQRLGESRHPRAAEALLAALHREWSSNVLKSIVQALWAWSRAHPEIPLDQVEKTIINTHTQRIESVASVLQDCNIILTGVDDQDRYESESRLITLLRAKRKSRLVRGLAAIGLGFSHTQVARDALLALFRQHNVDDFIGWCITDALTGYDDPVVADVAERIFFQKEKKRGDWSRHRARSIYLLGHTRHNEAIAPLLAQAMQAEYEENIFVRGYAVQTVVQLDLPEARQQIERLLEQETSPWVLRKIAEALGQLGTPASIPILEQHLFNDRAQTRLKVREAIEEIKIRYAL